MSDSLPISPAEASAAPEPLAPLVPDSPGDDVAAIDELGATFGRVRAELARVIQGQEGVIERLLICILARGHGLLMGVPGLAKTLMVHSLAQTMDLSFSRIQFTPDLMPSDITGTDILQETGGGHREFEFVQGPVFANIVLADEINRTPPKTQAALLEAMQERKVTVVGRTYDLEAPFFVLATQNPIEQEGTYALPEAQLDRFMFFIRVDYPDYEQELAIARYTTGDDLPALGMVLPGEKILEYQKLVRRVPVPDHVYDYVVRLVRLSRPGTDAPDWVNSWITWGAGPRAVQYLILGGKARAALAGNYMVGLEDVKAVANEVLSHRMQLTFHAESEGVTTLDIVERLMSEVNGDS